MRQLPPKQLAFLLPMTVWGGGEAKKEEVDKMGLELRELVERIGRWGQETWWFVQRGIRDVCPHSVQNLNEPEFD